MKLMDWLKIIFPKPQLPQKRYVIAAAVILYAVAKIYVMQTPTLEDDKLPDEAREMVVRYFADAATESDLTSEYDEDGMRYGESV